MNRWYTQTTRAHTPPLGEGPSPWENDTSDECQVCLQEEKMVSSRPGGGKKQEACRIYFWELLYLLGLERHFASDGVMLARNRWICKE